MYRGELDLALRLDQDLLRLSRQRNDSAGLVLAHNSSGRNLLLAGKLASSRSHLEEALALYDPMSHNSLAHQIGVHPHAGAQGFLALVLYCLGFSIRQWLGATQHSLKRRVCRIRRPWQRA
jgi:adenylate cyclase